MDMNDLYPLGFCFKLEKVDGTDLRYSEMVQHLHRVHKGAFLCVRASLHLLPRERKLCSRFGNSMMETFKARREGAICRGLGMPLSRGRRIVVLLGQPHSGSRLDGGYIGKNSLLSCKTNLLLSKNSPKIR